MPKKTRIINIPESDESIEDSKDFCIGCGMFRSLDIETSLCEDCTFKERDEEW